LRPVEQSGGQRSGTQEAFMSIDYSMIGTDDLDRARPFYDGYVRDPDGNKMRFILSGIAIS
jgi:hypothetical protein